MIKAIFSDFDGTLVDTFEANYMAYTKAFAQVGLSLSEQQYRDCFGLRFVEFMEAAGVKDAEIVKRIREIKAKIYPSCFAKLKPNKHLIDFLRYSRSLGIKTAIASTARRENLMAALQHVNAIDAFDAILSGEDVREGKPSPEIYNKLMDYFNIGPEETLIFEDSVVGVQAAQNAGAKVIKVHF